MVARWVEMSGCGVRLGQGGSGLSEAESCVRATWGTGRRCGCERGWGGGITKESYDSWSPYEHGNRHGVLRAEEVNENFRFRVLNHAWSTYA